MTSRIKIIPAFLLTLGLIAPWLSAAPIDQPQPFRAARVSSSDPTGANADRRSVEPHSRAVVADISGPGRIVHTWFTLSTQEPDYLHTTRIKMYWDGNDTPAVDVPFGDFHLLGHGLVRQVCSRFVTVVARPELNHNLKNKNAAGFNTWFPMPFARGAKIVLENNSDQPIDALYFQIDYQKWDAAPSPMRFHANYRQTPPGPRENPPGYPVNQDGRYNHIILDVQGAGHLVGVCLTVDSLGKGWWEGDDMIWIDGEKTPSIRGTGTEDYFGGAWGFRKEYNTPFHGVTTLQRVPGRDDFRAGLFCIYRFHKPDPIPFTRSIKMSIERGHANDRPDCPYSSVAYWYQKAD